MKWSFIYGYKTQIDFFVGKNVHEWHTRIYFTMCRLLFVFEYILCTVMIIRIIIISIIIIINTIISYVLFSFSTDLTAFFSSFNTMKKRKKKKKEENAVWLSSKLIKTIIMEFTLSALLEYCLYAFDDHCHFI